MPPFTDLISIYSTEFNSKNSFKINHLSFSCPRGKGFVRGCERDPDRGRVLRRHRPGRREWDRLAGSRRSLRFRGRINRAQGLERHGLGRRTALDRGTLQG